MTEVIALRHKQTALLNGDGTATVMGECMVTGEPYQVTVPAAGLAQWIAGAHIQTVMPEVSQGDREFLISGTSPKGWDLLFGEEED